MKVNEAPEKIYIQSFNVSEEDAKFARKLYFDDVWTEELEPGQENIEYVRKDAFIEKAEKYLKDQFIKDVSILAGGVVNINFSTAIKNFVSYIKGK